jgi:hypothetical protein
MRAAELDLPDIAAQIPAALWLFFQRRPYQDDWRTTHEIGLACARETGDAYTEGWLLNSIGKLHARAARFDDAHSCLAEALAIRRRLADPVVNVGSSTRLGLPTSRRTVQNWRSASSGRPSPSDPRCTAISTSRS